MKKSKPNAITLNLHMCGASRDYLRYNKISKKNIKTQNLYSTFALANAL